MCQEMTDGVRQCQVMAGDARLYRVVPDGVR
jgi:hypothetical protein